MERNKENAIVIFAFCAAMIDFLTQTQTSEIYVRDRIIHLIISIIGALILIFVIKGIAFNKGVGKVFCLAFIVLRLVNLWWSFSGYFATFHGSNLVSITFFTLLAILLIYPLVENHKVQMYSFFILFNIVIIGLVLYLSFENVNVINLYSNPIDFNFHPRKMFLFYDVITIAIIFQKPTKVRSQLQFLSYTGGIILLITLLQGLCLSGNMLYSISPLQGLTQAFTTTTIKRFDYIFSILQCFNYFGGLVLYIWAISKIFDSKKEVQNETI